MIRIETVTSALLVLLSGGCDSTLPTEEDAGTDVDIEHEIDADVEVEADIDSGPWHVEPPTAPAEPALPEEPALPRLRSWECPDGWRQIVHEGVTDENGDSFHRCGPPPTPRLRAGDYVTPLEDDEVEGDRPICDPAVDGTFPLVGYTECQPLGDPCPSGTWPTVPFEVPGGRIYVLAGAEDGDGTEALPFGAIGDAIDVAESGDVVVIGSGTYQEQVIVDRDLTLWGSCVQNTILESTMTFSVNRGAITVLGDVTATIRNLMITGKLTGVLAEGQVSIEGVWIHRSAGGVQCEQCAVTLSHVLVDSTIVAETDPYGRSGSGIVAWGEAGEATIEISASTFEQIDALGLYLDGASIDASCDDVVIRNPLNESLSADRLNWIGILARQNARIIARRVVVEDCVYAGIELQSGARCDAENVVVRRTRIDPRNREGAGVAVCSGADINATQIATLETEGYGVLCSSCRAEVGGTVSLEDAVVFGSRSNEHNYLEGDGIGIILHSGRMTIRRALLDNNEYYGFVAGYDGPDGIFADIEDIWISNTRQSRGGIGTGLSAVTHTSTNEFSVVRALVENSRYIGVYFETGEAPVRLVTYIEDITVRETLFNEVNGTSGNALRFDGPAEATVRRAHLDGNDGNGLLVGGATIDLQDISVTNTSDIAIGMQGIGCFSYAGATGTLVRGLFERNQASGISVVGEGTSFEIADVTVRGTLPASDGTGGHGVVVYEKASATMTRASIQDNHSFGAVILGAETEVRLEDISISGTVPDSDEENGTGLYVGDGATAHASRVAVRDSASAGLIAYGADTTLATEDVEIDRSWPGVLVVDGASMSILRGHIHDNEEVGISARNALAVTLDNVLVEDTVSSSDDSRFGRGLHFEGGGDLTVTDGQFHGNRDVSVAIFGEETTAALDHVLIGDSRERSCVDLDESDANHCIAGRGCGLGAYDGAVVTIDDVEITDSAGLGLQLADGGTVTGENLRITDCPVAVNLQSLPNDYEWEGAVSDVLLTSNETDIDESEMSIPEMLPE